MNHLHRIMAIYDFLGNAMTDEQAERLMDDARQNLGQDEILSPKEYVGSPLYTLLSMHCGEMGWH